MGLHELDYLQDDGRQMLRLVDLFTHVGGFQLGLDLSGQLLKEVEDLVPV